MKFLAPDQITEAEKERRRGIQDAIDTYQAYIDQEWARMKPHLDQYVAEGKYDQEKNLRQSIEQRVHQFKAAQAVYRRQVPPYLEIDAAGNFHVIQVGAEMLAKPK